MAAAFVRGLARRALRLGPLVNVVRLQGTIAPRLTRNSQVSPPRAPFRCRKEPRATLPTSAAGRKSAWRFRSPRDPARPSIQIQEAARGYLARQHVAHAKPEQAKTTPSPRWAKTLTSSSPPSPLHCRQALNLERLEPLLQKAFRGKPAAVALSINSPGGSAAQSALIQRRVASLARETGVPVYSFAEDYAASGG